MICGKVDTLEWGRSYTKDTESFLRVFRNVEKVEDVDGLGNEDLDIRKDDNMIILYYIFNILLVK
jgi:hypothetical protein